MKLLFTIDPDTTPEFVTGIILTYIGKNFDNIKDMVGQIMHIYNCMPINLYSYTAT